MSNEKRFIVIKDFNLTNNPEINTNGMFDAIEKINIKLSNAEGRYNIFNKYYNDSAYIYNVSTTWKSLVTNKTLGNNITFWLTTKDLRKLNITSKSNNVILVDKNIKNKLYKYAKKNTLNKINKCFKNQSLI